MKSFLYGMKKSIPVFFGFLPVAITFAIMAMGSGFRWYEVVGMSVFVFAGASQIMAVGMIGAGATAVSVIIATFVLNLRHLIMSTCNFRRIQIKNLILKMLAALSVTDEGFALINTEQEDRCDVPYVFGIITLTYLSWIFGTVVGVVANNVLPELISDSFGIALYALFIALVTPDVKKSLRLLLVVLLTATLNVFFSLFLPQSWAIIASTLVGAGIGVFFVGDEDVGMSDKPEEGGAAV